jgi:hypothetical protein
MKQTYRIRIGPMIELLSTEVMADGTLEEHGKHDRVVQGQYRGPSVRLD